MICKYETEWCRKHKHCCTCEHYKELEGYTLDTYNLDLGTDDEIKIFLKTNNIEDISPDMVRDYIKASMYKLFCETMYKK